MPAVAVEHEDVASASALADAALGCARDDPGRARALANEALRLARDEDDPAAVAIAERALGLATRADHDLDGSARHLRRAVRVAERHGLRPLETQARISLFGTLAWQGRFPAALREADRAAQHARGMDRARLELQRASVLMMQGTRLEEALDGLRRALPVVRRAGDPNLEATVLENRGLVHCYRGAMAAAEADLRRAEELRVGLGQERMAATVRQNLGFVAARRGDLPAALGWFEQADAYFRAQGIVDPMGLRDRCEALLPARLVTEARRTAEQAVAHLERHGVAFSLAEARLMLAEAALLDGDVGTARDAAERAARSFAAQHRPRHRQLAAYLSLRAAWQAGERSERLLAAARRSARTLADAGWPGPAQHARLIAGRLALALGRARVARAELEAASAGRRRGPLEPRIGAWHAEALLRLEDGNTAGAERALQAGMRLVEGHRALLGAPDLRAHASAYATDLATLGLRTALAAADPAKVLGWAERWRAGSLTAPPARPPADTRLERDLALLRQAAGEVEHAALEGKPTAGPLRRQARLERAVQERVRQVAPAGALRPVEPPTLADLAGRLGERALVEYVACDDALHAVVVAGGRARLVPLEALDGVAREATALRFALRRLAYGRGSAASRQAAVDAVAHGAKRLHELLLEPVADLVGDRALVLAPTGALHALPWAALPGCAGRQVSVVPSAGLWLRTARAAGRGRGTLLVAGPDLPEAEAEIDGISQRHPDARCLTGSDATAEAVARALDGAALGHVAAHGSFRTDNPLFSALRLADGQLTVYDLQRLRRPPEVLVLPACDSGLSDVQAGDELLGLVAVLLAMGTRAVVAPVTPVPDAPTRRLMVAFHEALAGGQPVAAALAGAQAAAGDDPAMLAAAGGFVCFGDGDATLAG